MAIKNKEDQGQVLWYVRRKEKVMGPFPSGTLRRFVLIGRIRIDDLVSTDKDSWQKVANVPEVVPREVRKAIAEGKFDQVTPAKLREDERTGRERRSDKSNQKFDSRRKGERRENEEETVKRHRKMREETQRLREMRKKPVVAAVVVSALALSGIGMGFYLGAPDPIPTPECEAPPVPGVNWRNCRLDSVTHESANLKGANLSSASLRDSAFTGSQFNQSDLKYVDFSGADLSYAELKQANLKGATLTKADLSYANLSAADLSYSNLTESNLGGANLSETILDHAIWVDGNTCLPGSLGSCRVSQ